MQKIIVTAKTHPYLIEYLSSKGYHVVYNKSMTYDLLYNQIQDALGVVTTTSITFDKNLIDQAKQLKWLGRLGSGMEHIDVSYATSKGIQCVSSPEGNCTAVGELALGMLLNLMRNITVSCNEVRQLIWKRDENRGTELTGKTVAIIGFGHTGNAFAKLLEPFGVKLLAHDKYKKNFGNHFIKEASLQEIFNEADIVSFHLPLTQEVKYYANTEFFHQFKKNIIVLNTSRGEVIKTQDLITVLQQKKVVACGLDVLENEQLQQLTAQQQNELNSLLAMQNVQITPHIAGYSHEALLKMATVLLEKLKL
jgi:D-3-phosphoglycerate dehydrogenase / 2-oxoglutarate reductase